MVYGKKFHPNFYCSYQCFLIYLKKFFTNKNLFFKSFTKISSKNSIKCELQKILKNLFKSYQRCFFKVITGIILLA